MVHTIDATMVHAHLNVQAAVCYQMMHTVPTVLATTHSPSNGEGFDFGNHTPPCPSPMSLFFYPLEITLSLDTFLLGLTMLCDVHHD